MKSAQISIAKAKSDKLFYVVASGTVYRRSDGRCLILRRDPREIVHPGKWASVGGKLEHKDFDLDAPSNIDGDVIAFYNPILDLLRREAKEEAGIELGDTAIPITNKVIVRPDGIPVLLLFYAVEYVSGEVVPEPGSFTDHAWVNTEEVKQYDCVTGVAGEIATTIATFNNG